MMPGGTCKSICGNLGTAGGALLWLLVQSRKFNHEKFLLFGAEKIGPKKGRI